MAGISKQVRLEKWISTRDGDGNSVETVTKYNCFAEVTKSSGGRSSLNGQTMLTDTIRFKVRFRPDFKPSGNWRIVYDGVRYTVQSIEKEKEERFYWIFTTLGSGVQR